ncbi:MAG: S1/P1 nuclease [Janthinobacterium lividum]
MKNITRVLPAIAGLALLVCLTPRASAWNGTGHMTVADIAYDNLTPNTKKAVNKLLMKQRDYALWMTEMPAGYTDKARFAFMKAATWPDDIRKTPDDRPIWHYIDLPVIAPGYTPDPAAIIPVTPNAETQIVSETALMTSKTATDQERAVALCWVEHLVGDIHQPLHDSSLFSAQFPKGDKGGNDESLASGAVDNDPLESAAHPHRLHALWDDLLGATYDPSEIQRIAATLETPAYARRSFPQIISHKAVHEWIEEGNALAQRYVYLNETLPMTATGDQKAEVTLPPGYLSTAHQVADQQIALAGYRLADALNAQKFP